MNPKTLNHGDHGKAKPMCIRAILSMGTNAHRFCLCFSVVSVVSVVKAL
jgi:hypothetical protein